MKLAIDAKRHSGVICSQDHTATVLARIFAFQGYRSMILLANWHDDLAGRRS
jgi:hypothetical protein